MWIWGLEKKKPVIEHFGFGDLFSFGKEPEKQIINVDNSSKGNPPSFSTLNFPNSNSADAENVDFNGDLAEDLFGKNNGLSETEIAINQKFNNNLPIIPNYTRNPELVLDETVRELKGNGELDKFKKEVIISSQKPQPQIVGAINENQAKDLLDKHMNDIAKINGTGVSAPPSAIQPTNEIVAGMKCKFLNSSQCHPDYPNFSGASIAFDGDIKMKCDSIGEEVLPRAVCTIQKGKINGVYIINPGKGLSGEPDVKVVGGGGKGAILKAIVGEGNLKDIKIINAGEGFHETPKIVLESANVSNSCYLCCK